MIKNITIPLALVFTALIILPSPTIASELNDRANNLLAEYKNLFSTSNNKLEIKSKLNEVKSLCKSYPSEINKSTCNEVNNVENELMCSSQLDYYIQGLELLKANFPKSTNQRISEIEKLRSIHGDCAIYNQISPDIF